MALSSILRSTWTYGMVLLVLYLLIGSSLVWITAISYGTLLLVGGGALVSWLIISRLRGTESADTDESDSVWNAIPSWQYNGRHVESGGLARGEQEQALQEIHDDAAQRHNQSHNNR